MRSFMAHHQGMSLLSLAYLLLDRPMQRRFEADPHVPARRCSCCRSACRRPRAGLPARRRGQRDARPSTEARGADARLHRPEHAGPGSALLSNGRYHVMVTNAGGGYSRWRDLAVTRWREDATRDCWGTFCYLRDLDERRVLVDRVSADAQARAQTLRGDLHQARAEFRRRDDGSRRTPRSASRPRTTSSCGASRITNRSRTRSAPSRSPAMPRSCWRPPAPMPSHPAFSNLFVQTELVRDAAGDPLHAPAALGRASGRRG